jgi:hypothetical protein
VPVRDTIETQEALMPDLVRLEDVRRLLDHRDGPCVSLFMPTHRTAPERDQDPIRLKNLLGRAEEQLEAAGHDHRTIAEVLGPGRRLVDDPLAWRGGAEGLALFLAPGEHHAFFVDLDLPELVAVGERFQVKPLLPPFSADGLYHALALSRGKVRLFAGARGWFRQVDLGSAPTSREEFLRYDDLEKQHLLHVAGRGAPLFHGHGIGQEVERTLDERFCRAIDDAVLRAVGDRRAPLVLAGVEEITAIYRDVSRHPRILEAFVPGNPDPLRPEELHERTWAIVEPEFAAARRAAAERFHELAGRGTHATDDLAAVVAAAVQGRVDTLFVATDRQRWGRVDAATGSIEVHDRWEPGDEDLLDLAAVRTLLTSGTVYAVPPEAVPGGTDAAAILRY